ncbi:hypothetical protein P3T27_003392 [Kitasatospora sp. MAA19]|nr:hypothetical protein [Kitasatospora sp. MAA19]
MFTIFDRDPALGPMTLRELSRHVLPDDISATGAAMRRLLGEGRPIDVPLRIRTRHGTKRLRIVAEAVTDADGAPVEVHGFFQDLTEQALAQQALGGAQRAVSAQQQTLHTEHLLAARLQEALLPVPTQPLDIAGLRCEVSYLSAEAGTPVGGDWFTVLEMPDGSALLTWAQAGHPPLLRLRDGAADALSRPAGRILGADPGSEYELAQSELRPGDRLFLFTDGLVERHGEDLRIGLDRLTKTIEDLAAANPCAAIARELTDGRARRSTRRHLPAVRPRPLSGSFARGRQTPGQRAPRRWRHFAGRVSAQVIGPPERGLHPAPEPFGQRRRCRRRAAGRPRRSPDRGLRTRSCRRRRPRFATSILEDTRRVSRSALTDRCLFDRPPAVWNRVPRAAAGDGIRATAWPASDDEVDLMTDSTDPGTGAAGRPAGGHLLSGPHGRGAPGGPGA